MTNEVRFHPLAEIDLDGIYDWIAEDNPASAIEFVRGLKALCLSLSLFPQGGRKRPELGRHVRSLSYRRRAIMTYQMTDDSIRILRIFYAGYNMTELDFPEL